MARYEALPMRGAVHHHDWMVVECDDRFQRQFDHIIAWSYQGKPENNEKNARLVAAALNAYRGEEQAE